MANNNIHCDCKVAWMKNFRALSRSDPILCTTPEAFAGRRVDDLTIEELNCGKLNSCRLKTSRLMHNVTLSSL